jgi:hypothetical protein
MHYEWNCSADMDIFVKISTPKRNIKTKAFDINVALELMYVHAYVE